jgi:hypothetical protein
LHHEAQRPGCQRQDRWVQTFPTAQGASGWPTALRLRHMRFATNIRTLAKQGVKKARAKAGQARATKGKGTSQEHEPRARAKSTSQEHEPRARAKGTSTPSVGALPGRGRRCAVRRRLLHEVRRVRCYERDLLFKASRMKIPV